MKRLSLVLLLSGAAVAAKWADRGEYDLALAVRAESAASKRLALLDAWKTKYPASEFQQVRQELYLGTYQSLGDSQHSFDTAAEMVKADPNNSLGIYWYTVLLPQTRSASPDQLALGEKSARALMGSAETRPLGQRTLGWVLMQRGEYAQAEEQLSAAIQSDPANLDMAAWLGIAQAAQQKQVPALWNLARAAGQQRQTKTLLERLYTEYHGSADGLDQLIASAANSPKPPAGFTIESASAAAIQKDDEALAKIDPKLPDWARIRRRLQAPDGEKYFAGSLKGQPLPRLKGTVIQSTATDLSVGLLNATTTEIVLKLSSPLDVKAGASIEFEGAMDSFTPNPFLLTVIADPAKIGK
jgi:tetratricopeptide (TPR) repeat protein